MPNDRSICREAFAAGQDVRTMAERLPGAEVRPAGRTDAVANQELSRFDPESQRSRYLVDQVIGDREVLVGLAKEAWPQASSAYLHRMSWQGLPLSTTAEELEVEATSPTAMLDPAGRKRLLGVAAIAAQAARKDFRNEAGRIANARMSMVARDLMQEGRQRRFDDLSIRRDLESEGAHPTEAARVLATAGLARSEGPLIEACRRREQGRALRADAMHARLAALQASLPEKSPLASGLSTALASVSGERPTGEAAAEAETTLRTLATQPVGTTDPEDRIACAQMIDRMRVQRFEDTLEPRHPRFREVLVEGRDPILKSGRLSLAGVTALLASEQFERMDRDLVRFTALRMKGEEVDLDGLPNTDAPSLHGAHAVRDSARRNPDQAQAAYEAVGRSPEGRQAALSSLLEATSGTPQDRASAAAIMRAERAGILEPSAAFCEIDRRCAMLGKALTPEHGALWRQSLARASSPKPPTDDRKPTQLDLAI